MTEPATSVPGATSPKAAASVPAVTLRVAEARVDDIAHAIARLSPADLERIGGRRGDILKITGRTIAVARAEVSDPEHDGVIQIDGTLRSNCGTGLEEQVTAVPVEAAQAVAVRFTPLWAGAAPAIVAPERMLADLVGVPVVTGSAVRVPTFAKAINFQVVRTMPAGPVVIGPRTDIRIVEGEPTVGRFGLQMYGAPAAKVPESIPKPFSNRVWCWA